MMFFWSIYHDELNVSYFNLWPFFMSFFFWSTRGWGWGIGQEQKAQHKKCASQKFPTKRFFERKELKAQEKHKSDLKK